jgi:Mrp family chromosome partitioning ATPase/DUF971 family protein
MVTEQDVLNVLRRIIDPDFNKDIVSLGFVKNIKIEGRDVSLEIELTTPACPVKAEFQRQAEAAVQSIKGIRHVAVRMTAQQRTQPAPVNAQSALSGTRAIIAVSSCKGGVGKSTVAAHLSQELANRGFKVGLVDVDIHGPSIPALFNLKNVTVTGNEKKQIVPVERNNLKIMSFGFLLGDAPAVVRGPIITQYVQQILHNTAWGELDYLFIDMPPGTGDVQLTITQTVRLSGAVIVTTPQTLSLIDVARGILMFEKVSVPILGLIENMSYFLCDNCDKRHYIFGKNTSGSLKERFGIETLAELPLLPQLTMPLDKPTISNSLIIRAVDNVVMALGKSMLNQKQIPTIKFDPRQVSLTWPDGRQVTVNNRDLRLSCQCALCVDELTGEKTLKEVNIKEDIAPKTITPLGNYAVGVTWNDGHSSGIYPYRNIERLEK